MMKKLTSVTVTDRYFAAKALVVAALFLLGWGEFVYHLSQGVMTFNLTFIAAVAVSVFLLFFNGPVLEDENQKVYIPLNGEGVEITFDTEAQAVRVSRRSKKPLPEGMNQASISGDSSPN